MSEFYCGDKLLAMKDINDKRPEIYICSTNRGTGKTTFFSKYLLDKFKKILILCRYSYELDNCGLSFFKPVTYFKKYKNFIVTEKTLVRNSIKEIFMQESEESEPISIGYVTSVNNADLIKKKRYLVNDVEAIVFDEFQSEKDQYCDREVEKLQSIHTTVASAWGEQVRYVPVFMLSNQVSICNPYYLALGISERLTEKTKFLRGSGWVLEDNFYPNVGKKQSESAFNRAFASGEYTNYVTSKTYLNNYYGNVLKQTLKGARPIQTLLYMCKKYGVWTLQNGCFYVSKSFIESVPVSVLEIEKVTNGTFYMRSRLSNFYQLRDAYNMGLIFFENQECRNVFFQAMKC